MFIKPGKADLFSFEWSFSTKWDNEMVTSSGEVEELRGFSGVGCAQSQESMKEMFKL